MSSCGRFKQGYHVPLFRSKLRKIGQLPKEVWEGVPLFEKVHYILVLGFNKDKGTPPVGNLVGLINGCTIPLDIVEVGPSSLTLGSLNQVVSGKEGSNSRLLIVHGTN